MLAHNVCASRPCARAERPGARCAAGRGHRRMSHAQRLRQRIEDEIVSGELALGSRLDEAQLAARFGVSRTPIREALLQLAVTGLVQTKPRRGAIVSAPEPHLLLA